jgi:hypothetical protein
MDGTFSVVICLDLSYFSKINYSTQCVSHGPGTTSNRSVCWEAECMRRLVAGGDEHCVVYYFDQLAHFRDL